MAGLYVQYGCGLCAPEQWVNFDASLTLRLQKVPGLGILAGRTGVRFPASVRYGDIVKGLPVTAQSVDGLYASHVLEHLPLDACHRALANSRALLKPGGRFRLVVPDLKTRARQYAAAPDDDADAAHLFLRSCYLGRPTQPSGPIGRLRQLFGRSEHLWMWDEASMAAALRAVGFSRVRRCAFGDSGNAMFDLVEDEGRFFSDGHEELAMEAIR